MIFGLEKSSDTISLVAVPATCFFLLWLKVLSSEPLFFRVSMNIGSMQVLATAPLPVLFADDCLCAGQVEVELGDICKTPAAPGKPTDPTGDQGQVPWLNRRQKAQLRQFLHRNNFRTLKDPIRVGGEELYPIHVAAKLGKCRILRFLLNEGVDVNQTTSHGRTAMDFAKQAPTQSQSHVVNVLSQENAMTLHDFLGMPSMVSSTVVKAMRPQLCSL